MHILSYLFVIEIICLSTCIQDDERNTSVWDYLVFSQQWPTTTCTIWKNMNTKNTCYLPDTLNHWTIHGIWPSKITGKDPEFCNNTFDFNQIQPLVTILNNYWPNIYNGTPQDDFWKHEWTKHGTCAATDLRINDEYGYFARGIQILTRYDMNIALANIGIKPNFDKPYKRSDMHSAILDATGVLSTITCYHDKHSNRSLIKEIRICLGKDLMAISCPEQRMEANIDQDCPKDDLVFYLPINSTTIHKTHERNYANEEL